MPPVATNERAGPADRNAACAATTCGSLFDHSQRHIRGLARIKPLSPKACQQVSLATLAGKSGPSATDKVLRQTLSVLRERQTVTLSISKLISLKAFAALIILARGR